MSKATQARALAANKLLQEASAEYRQQLFNDWLAANAIDEQAQVWARAKGLDDFMFFLYSRLEAMSNEQ